MDCGFFAAEAIALNRIGEVRQRVYMFILWRVNQSGQCGVQHDHVFHS